MEADRNQQWQALRRALENLLGNRVGLTEGCREVLRHGQDLVLDTPLFDPFIGYESESDVFPLGNVREFWSAHGLELMDHARATVEAHYRGWILEAAKKLLDYAAERCA